MSFASYCKDEASLIKFDNQCCKKALLEALTRLNAEVILRSNKWIVSFTSANAHVAGLFMKLAKELYQAEVNLISKESNKFDKKQQYVVEVVDNSNAIIEEFTLLSSTSPNHQNYQNNECCCKAYLRGAFLARGSVNDPQKSSYHLEIRTALETEAVFIQYLLNKFDLNAKITRRRNDLVIYLKEISKITDFLRIIGVNQMVFKMEEIQIQNEFTNEINRKVNCEIANGIKTLDAAKQQLKNIQYLEYNYPLEKMDPKILLIMKVRKDNPEATFKELLNILNNDYEERITKSGLNHRFIKIKSMVEELKKNSK